LHEVTNIYPGIFTFIGLGRMLASTLDHVSAWSQEVRDKEFLVEMRLKNHEPDTEDNEPESIKLDKGKTVAGRPIRWAREEENEIL
jgi:E3 ubiquitin-protein ligase MARCH6